MTAMIFIPASYAQENASQHIQVSQTQQNEEELSLSVHVESATVLASENMKILLWGIEAIQMNASVFNLKVRSALEKKIGNEKILCTVKQKKSASDIRAQCINSREEDLSLFLLQQGFATAARGEIYGTLYEVPYLKAEEQAQNNKKGAWGNTDPASSPGDKQSRNFMMGAFFLMVVLVISLGLLSVYIMRGFRRVVDIQNQSIELATRERALREKEKFIIASMLHTEVKSNKAKIEAYLMIYEETLQGFTSFDRAPEYLKTGEVVQKQPALDRAIFDGNTSRLDLLGSRMSSAIIHYYARIKSTPDYVELHADMEENEAQEIIEKAVSRAKKLMTISDKLLEEFEKNALIKQKN